MTATAAAASRPAEPAAPDHVFAYGSLTAGARGAPAVLHGHRRVWGVAMDNGVDVPGYKAYLAPDGSRPAVCVAFLDVVEAPGEVVPGILLPADEALLAALDRRERNYRRVDVTAAVQPAPGRVWAYAGRPESRERLRRARAEGRAVVQAAYARSVARWAATTEPSGLPEVELERVDLP